MGFEVRDIVDETRSPDVLIGPPSYLADQVVAYAQLGVADVSVRPGQSDDASRRTVDALGTLIIPELRAYEAGRSPSDSGK